MSNLKNTSYFFALFMYNENENSTQIKSIGYGNDD